MAPLVKKNALLLNKRQMLLLTKSFKVESFVRSVLAITLDKSCNFLPYSSLYMSLLSWALFSPLMREITLSDFKNLLKVSLESATSESRAAWMISITKLGLKPLFEALTLSMTASRMSPWFRPAITIKEMNLTDC